jgi:hypothetical protein
MDMQFVSFNFILKYLFDVLNKQLLSIFDIHSERALEQNLLDDICKDPKKSSEHSNMPFVRKVNTVNREYHNVDEKLMWKRSPLTEAEYIPNINPKQDVGLQELRIHHNEICNIARLVVSTYGVYIIFELLTISADIITVLYFITDCVISEGYVNMETIGLCSLWLILHASKLMSVTRSCQLVSNCGNHTSVLVVKLMLLSRPLPSSTMIQLQMFSHQLLHTKLHLSDCDFFDLNNTVLKSVVKVAISYVIVLLLNQTI